MPFPKPKMFNSAHQLLEECAQAVVDGHRANSVRGLLPIRRFNAIKACNENWRAKNAGGLRAFARLSHRRCRDRACVPCLLTERSEARNTIMRAYSAAIKKHKSMTPVFLTIDGPEFPTHWAKDALNATSLQWTNFYDRKAFHSAVSGFARSFSFRISHIRRTVRTRTRMILLSERPKLMPTANDWLRHWNRGHTYGPSSVSFHLQLDGAERVVSPMPKVYAFRLSNVAVRPTDLCERANGHLFCDPVTLHQLRTALQDRRLINFGGDMRTD